MLAPCAFILDREYQIDFKMHVPTTTVSQVAVPHANLHSCLRNNIFCTPFVANTPMLATHALALSGQLDADGDATFVNANQLVADQYTIIAHGRWFDSSGTKHDMARARIQNIDDPPPDNTAMVVIQILSAVIGSALVIGMILLIRNMVRRYRAAVLAAAELQKKRKEQVTDAISQVQTCLYPFCVVKFSDFRTFGKLLPHEHCRDSGLLKILDTWELATEFASKNLILFVSQCERCHLIPARVRVPDTHCCARASQDCSKGEVRVAPFVAANGSGLQTQIRTMCTTR
jgi:hypothetical protein